ncbi:MAG: reverse transcriptase-like protein [Sphingomonadales bacterium]|nr:reverse transcriptase-like protein [Sphingomonadales bacterium]
MVRKLKVFFDGGCRPNPGPMEAAVVIRGLPQFFSELGIGSNTDSEWHALFCAIAVARDLGLEAAEFVGDSLEVTRRATVALRTGHADTKHAATLLSLLSQYRPSKIRWIKREQNLAGIALERRRST